MKRFILSFWHTIDTFYYACTRLTYIAKHENIFRVVIKKYRGRPLIFSPQHRIQEGDWICKIHLHNFYLAKELQGAKSEVEMAIRFLRLIRSSLPGLAQFLSAHPQRNELVGLLGTTKLTPRSERLGFKSLFVPDTLYFQVKNVLLTLLFHIIHVNSPLGAQRQLHIPMKYLFMPLDQLFELYLKEEASHE